MPIVYHAGQIEVQTEANTRPVADKLAHWVGPIAEFMAVADLVVLATPVDDRLRFSALSGRPPLLDVVGPGSVALRASLPIAMPGDSVRIGALAISLAQRRRARLNGELNIGDQDAVLDATETFTNCRKYVAPSVALEDATHVGPAARVAIRLDDPAVAAILARAETAFLASVSPDGSPDVSHRGGPPGFLTLDAGAALLTWPEYVGDGMLKSAGNVRASGRVALLVVDLASGDAIELTGRAAYETLMTRQRARTEGLERHRDPFPHQGRITMHVETVERLNRMITPRRPIAEVPKLNSSSPLEEQEPQ